MQDLRYSSSIFGANGYTAPLGSDKVESWDGSSWTEVQ